MPSRRAQIQMTPEEIRAYLLSQRRMILVTNGPDGLPHPVPMSFGLDEQDRILIGSFRKTQKVRNLERDPRATLLVESGATYHELKSVIVFADAELITEPALVLELIGRINAGRTMNDSVRRPMDEQAQASLAKRLIIRLTPFRYVSWDHGKLGEDY